MHVKKDRKNDTNAPLPFPYFSSHTLEVVIAFGAIRKEASNKERSSIKFNVMHTHTHTRVRNTISDAQQPLAFNLLGIFIAFRGIIDGFALYAIPYGFPLSQFPSWSHDTHSFGDILLAEMPLAWHTNSAWCIVFAPSDRHKSHSEINIRREQSDSNALGVPAIESSQRFIDESICQTNENDRQ